MCVGREKKENFAESLLARTKAKKRGEEGKKRVKDVCRKARSANAGKLWLRSTRRM